MTLRRTHHSTYDTKYHLVWTPKRRRWIGNIQVRKRISEIIQEVANNHNMQIDALEIAPDHVHVFISFPPSYSIAKVVGMLKSISASVIYKEFPDINQELYLYKTTLWERGYFVRTVGDKVTAQLVKNYIKHHQEKETKIKQLSLF